MLKISVAFYLLSFVICVQGEFNLTIVHISDFHSHWFEYDENKTDCSERESNEGRCFGGFPRLITFVRDIRRKEKNVLVLSSGEFFLGRSLNAVHGWKMAHALLPRLELDAMSLSNQDFDSGIYELSAFLYAMKFPVLCANMWAKETTFLYSRVNKSTVIEVSGKKIGIVGYIHRHAQKKTKNAVSVKFLPEIPALKEEVRRLENEGIDKIIALGHAGYYTDLEIAKEVKGLDVVIGGDSDIMLFDSGHDADESEKVGNIHGNYPRIHHQEPEVENGPSIANRTLILHIPRHGMYVGVLRATFDDQGKIIHESGEPILLNSRIPQDNDTLEFLKFAKTAQENITEHSRLPHRDEVLGEALKPLEGNRRICRMGECTLGNFLADAILHEFTFHYRNNSEPRYEIERWGPIDAVVLNSGPILSSIESGPITLQHIVNAVRLGEFIKRVYMSGQHLLNMMEHSVRHYDVNGVTPPGAFLQIAGLKVEYDLSQNPGSRVRNLTIRCRDCGDDSRYFPVKPFKTYVIGMPNFLRDGRDGFYDFEETDTQDFGQFDALLIVEHLRRMFYIEPKLDGRIKFYNPSNKVSEKETISLLFFNEKESSLSNDKNLSVSLENNQVSASISSLNESFTSSLDFSNAFLETKNKSISTVISPMNLSSTIAEDLKTAVSENKLISSVLFVNDLPTTIELKNVSVYAENVTLLPSTEEFEINEEKIVERSGHRYNEQFSRKGISSNDKTSTNKEMPPTKLFSNEVIPDHSYYITSKLERHHFTQLDGKLRDENFSENQNLTDNSSSEDKEKNISSISPEDESTTENNSKTSDTLKVILKSNQENLPVLEKVQKVITNFSEKENILDSDSRVSDNQIAKRSVNKEGKLQVETNETFDSLQNMLFFSAKSFVHKTFMNVFTIFDSMLDGLATSGSLNTTENDGSSVINYQLKKTTVPDNATDKTSYVTPRTIVEELFKWILSVSHAPLHGKASFLSEKMNETRSLLKKMYHFLNKDTNTSFLSMSNFV